MFAPSVPALPRRGSADSSSPSRASSKEITPLGTVNTIRRDLGSVLVTWSSDRRSHEEVCSSATDDSARAAGTLNLAAQVPKALDSHLSPLLPREGPLTSRQL
jgi:hypothetical protein